MSTTEEIREVYREEIARPTRLILRKRGILTFYRGTPLTIKNLYADLEDILVQDNHKKRRVALSKRNANDRGEKSRNKRVET